MIREFCHLGPIQLYYQSERSRTLLCIENPEFLEMADDKDVEKTIAEDLVVTKYKLAGQIVNRKFCLCWYLI